MPERQQVLYLWANGSSLDSFVVAWAFHDGSDGTGPGIPDDEPPYPSGEAALGAGWFLLQSSQLLRPPAGEEHVNSFLDYEFVLERRMPCPWAVEPGQRGRPSSWYSRMSMSG